MDYGKRLSQIHSRAHKLRFDDGARIVLMSDCHRGDGGLADTFFRNRNIYIAALRHYHAEKFTYIELGDGDELWENRHFSDIVEAHADVFDLLARFHAARRLYMLFGNHDIVKASPAFARHPPDFKLDARQYRLAMLFSRMPAYEAIRLVYAPTGGEIFLVHGHQVDFCNSTMWRLTRFLVRYVWRPLESRGVKDPTSAAKNYAKRRKTEERLIGWVSENGRVLVSGHTHRPTFPAAGEPPYFNDGSCVHPGCVTAVEIAGGSIALVKWCVKVRADGTLYVGRDVIAGPAPLTAYFNARR
ncbi:MAG: serine/threonine protein phosphatase [Christensenellaceae bacterium]|nr:serine/threonine protein phosphatase [Christensenellaceae bacterium]